MIRFFFNFLVFISIFLLNWWLFLLTLTIGVLIFKKFYEGLIYALLFDFVYLLNGFNNFYLQITVSAIFLVIILVIENLKRYLRYYPENI